MPLSASSLAVPPVERIFTPSWSNPCANSRTPDLSDTLMSACLIAAMLIPMKNKLQANCRRSSSRSGFSPTYLNGHTHFPLPNPLPQAGEGANESLRELRLIYAVLLHLLAQGIAIDTQHFRRAGLVAANVFQHHFEQRLFDAVNYHVVHFATGRFAVEVFEIFLERFAHVARHFILADQPTVLAASSSM